METIIRNVRDIKSGDRRILEHVFGRQLQEDQQVIVQIVTARAEPVEKQQDGDVTTPQALPEWCNVFEGLNDDQIADVEQVILQRADMTRPSL